jgi:hypothetical protein
VTAHVRTCNEHTVRIKGYIAFFDDCECRKKLGEHQVICDECGLYCWPLMEDRQPGPREERAS